MKLSFVHRMFVRSFAVCIVLSCCFAGDIFGQSTSRIHHKVESEVGGESPYLGRDYWLAIPQNYGQTADAQKEFEIYITATKNTIVNIQRMGQAVDKRPVTAGKTLVYRISPAGAAELKTAAVIEQTKAIHIWSDNSDLSVYFLSRNLYTSDGMYVIPSTGWGKEYVVAGFASLQVVIQNVDLPSEFVIVANQDNTRCTVIPSQDFRDNNQPTVVKHPKGVPFTVTLNKGECIQYQVTRAQDDSWDVTGTVITANNPIGVVGASQCPFIPTSDPYCDHIVDMIPPVRTWSNTYYTVPFTGRRVGGDTFLAIGSKAGQVIYRNGQQFATLNRFGFIFDNNITDASVWTSSDPFLLVQYINSATFGITGGGPRNEGDPAMVVINPAEQFARKIVFQTPVLTGSGQPKFFHYVNILLPTASFAKTTFDGFPLTNIPGTKIDRLPIPGTNWEGVRISYTTRGTGEGTHTVVADTGIGIYIYGYSTDDSYAWAGALGTKTPNDIDVVAPLIDSLGDCFCGTIKLSDVHPNASKISSFVIDTIYNMVYNPDPNFTPGSGTDSSFYSFCVIDSALEAYMSVTIYDIAGNRTTVISTYQPQYASIAPNPLNFGTGSIGTDSYGYLTITNNGTVPFDFKNANLKLKPGGQGFFIDSTGGDGPIPAGGTRQIKIRFNPIVGTTVTDTVLFGDECTKTSTRLIGNGGSADFIILPYDFDCSLPGKTKSTIGYKIINNSGGDVTIDSIYIDDVINFGYDRLVPPTNTCPFIVPKQNVQSGEYEVVFTFTPSAPGNFSTLVHIHGKSGNNDIGWKTAELKGIGCLPQILTRDSSLSVNCPDTLIFTVPIRNFGNVIDTITAVFNNNQPIFTAPTLTDYTGTNATLPYNLLPDPTKPLVATLRFIPPPNATGTYSDKVYFIRKNGDTAAVANINIKAASPMATVTRDTAQFGTVPFGAPVRRDSVVICNTSTDSITISSVQKRPINDTASFQDIGLYRVGGKSYPLPVKLAPGECLSIIVEFDASVSKNVAQSAEFVILSDDGCQKIYTAEARAALAGAPPRVLGTTYPTILSCLNMTDSISVFNPISSPKEITNVRFSGVDAANFSYTGGYPVPLPDDKETKIPIQFNPTPQMGVVSYSAWVVVTINDPANNTSFIDSAQVTGQSAGVDIRITSIMTRLTAEAGDNVQLPVVLSNKKEANLTTPLDVLNIRRIDVSYQYNTELLNLDGNNIASAVTGLPAGWSVDPDPTRTNLDAANSRLNISFVGTVPLADNVTELARIRFGVMLTKQDTTTEINLVSQTMYSGTASPLQNCAAVTTADSNFALILRCGDALLQKFMRDGLIVASFISPVTPNPVTDNNGFIKIHYGVRFEGVVTLELVDEMGNVVMRPVERMNLPAGEYDVSVRASALPSGTYVARLVVAGAAKGVTSTRFVVTK